MASAQPDLAGSAGLQIAGTWHLSPDTASVSLQTLSSGQVHRQSLVVLSKLWLKSAGYLADHAPSPSLATPGQATERHEWSSPASLSNAETTVDRHRQSIVTLLTFSLHSSVQQFYKRYCQWRDDLIFRAMLSSAGHETVEDEQKAVDWLHEQCTPKRMNNTTTTKVGH